MSRIAIVDYGMGNLHSMARAVERVGGGAHIFLASEPEQLLRADKVIFPGVGAIRSCMAELQRLGLDEALRQVAANKPLLGVCLGMQALFEHSAESGGCPGLGVLPGMVEPLASENAGVARKVPHIGWNRVHQLHEHPLWDGIAQDATFYFIHSFHAVPRTPEMTVAQTDYRGTFVSALWRDNIFAVQCNPEKSRTTGLRLLTNFINWDG